MSKKNKKQYGIYYVSNGRWVGPYLGWMFTKYMSERDPLKTEIQNLKNYTLKSRVAILKVTN